MTPRSLALLMLPACAAATADAPVQKPAPVTSSTSFAAKLDGELAKRSGNLIYSPISVQAALAMAREGARGSTADEMDRVLGASAGRDVQALLASIKPTGTPPEGITPPELAIANRIFADRTTPFERAFLDTTSTAYGAPAEPVDFRTAADAAREHINAWVADRTHDRIRDLLGQGTVDAATRMVLVNAIYMKAQWATPFEPSLTAPAPFAIAGGAAKQVPTMHTQTMASWGAHAGARTLDLRYSSVGGPRLSMLLIVPEGKTLELVERAYASEGLAPFVAATASGGRVDVALPKFEIGTTFELSDALDHLGMHAAFSDGADFSGISSVATKISAVVHKAWAKVDEAGTEAAAATAVVMAETTSVQVDPPHVFKVDRSFLFAIHDDKGNVLFAGRVSDPSL